MAVALSYESVPVREIGAKVESFEARKAKQRQRVRLTADEAWPIRYVFTEWVGEVGMGSSAAQLERLAALPGLLKPAPDDAQAAAKAVEEAIAREWSAYERARQADVQVIVAKASRPSFRDTYSATERWADTMLQRVPKPRGSGYVVERSEKGDKVHHAWRTLKALSHERSMSLVILHALFGDRPPGLPDVPDTLLGKSPAWTRSDNQEYIRVVRFVDSSGGSGAAFEAMLRLEGRKREGEADDAFKARYAAAQAARIALMERSGRACNAIIQTATEDYRFFWSATGST